MNKKRILLITMLSTFFFAFTYLVLGANDPDCIELTPEIQEQLDIAQAAIDAAQAAYDAASEEVQNYLDSLSPEDRAAVEAAGELIEKQNDVNKLEAELNDLREADPDTYPGGGLAIAAMISMRGDELAEANEALESAQDLADSYDPDLLRDLLEGYNDVKDALGPLGDLLEQAIKNLADKAKDYCGL